MEEELVTVSARIKKSQVEQIERLASERGLDRSAIIRELLNDALKRKRLEEALNQVREMKITVWRASEKAGVTYREMLQLLKIYNVSFPLTVEGLKREIREITGQAS